jgi:hypothetical protein
VAVTNPHRGDYSLFLLSAEVLRVSNRDRDWQGDNAAPRRRAKCSAAHALPRMVTVAPAPRDLAPLQACAPSEARIRGISGGAIVTRGAHRRSLGGRSAPEFDCMGSSLIQDDISGHRAEISDCALPDRGEYVAGRLAVRWVFWELPRRAATCDLLRPRSHTRVDKPYLLAPKVSLTLAEMASRNGRPTRSGRSR